MEMCIHVLAPKHFLNVLNGPGKFRSTVAEKKKYKTKKKLKNNAGHNITHDRRSM